MPSIDDVFGGTTLRSEDIKGKGPVIATIDQVTVKEFTDTDGKAKKKLMVTFLNSKKALVCNVTNARRIAYIYGNDYTQWSGKKIKLQVDMVDFAGRVTDGIRVYPPDKPTHSPDRIETGPQPPRQPVARPSMKDELEDEIPEF